MRAFIIQNFYYFGSTKAHRGEGIDLLYFLDEFLKK